MIFRFWWCALVWRAILCFSLLMECGEYELSLVTIVRVSHGMNISRLRTLDFDIRFHTQRPLTCGPRRYQPRQNFSKGAKRRKAYALTAAYPYRRDFRHDLRWYVSFRHWRCAYIMEFISATRYINLFLNSLDFIGNSPLSTKTLWRQHT